MCEDGRISFADLKELNTKFPMLLYPVFRMQNTLMRVSLGTSWWKKKKAIVAEEMKVERSKMKNIEDEMDEKEREKRQLELDVKMMMGVAKYHLLFWQREKFRKKVLKLRKIEAELQAREEFENEESD